MTPDCAPSLEALREALASGADLDPGARAHLGSCTACRGRLAALVNGPEESCPAPDSTALEAEARRRYRRRRLGRALGLGLAALLLGAVAVVALAGKGLLPGGAGLAAALLAGLALAGALAWALGRVPARLGLYKRLRPGRQVSGVCLGLAERTGTPPWAWRVGFLVLAWLGGWGLGLYLLLDLAMPVHPEDRPRLLRYRLARWWRGLRAA